MLTDLFSPKLSKIAQYSKFYNRSRKPGESISTFMVELLAIAEHCNFGPSLDSMIRDRLVCGINDDAKQKRLLAEGVKLMLTKSFVLSSVLQNS